MNIIEFIRLKILRRFINLKQLTGNDIPYDEIIRIELLVSMCLISLILGTAYIVVGLFVNVSFLVLLNYLLYFSITVPTVLILVSKGYHNIGKLIIMILGGLFMLIKASSLGRDSGMNMAMLIILFGTFAFYRIEDYKYILFSLVLLLGGIVFLEYTDYSYFGKDLSTNSYEYYINLSATILFCILFYYIVLRVNQYTNIKLKDLNVKLLQKNTKLEKTNRELDNYVYKASHDLRAPLTSLMGIVNLLKIETDPKKIQELVVLQENCIIKLDDHIHQIIDLSKNAKIEPNAVRIDVRNLVEQIMKELSFYENAPKTSIVLNINQHADFFSDEFRLKIILSNLISNAFKYANKTQEHPEIMINAAITREAAHFSIQDNGIGITEEHIPKIFDMFYRGTDINTGSGLGLYMVKEMVIKLDGTISVRSIPKQFTRFEFSLPNKSLKKQ